MIRFFAWQLLIALDQLVNVLFGGYADEYANITTGGNKNETWSSRFGRGKLAGRKRYVVLAAIVDFFARVFAGQKNHCVDSINEKFLEREK